MVKLYVDGACNPNPGRGAWSVYNETLNFIAYGNISKSIITTNNEMEFLAALKALQFIKIEAPEVTIYSDSQLMVKIMKNEWKAKREALKVYRDKINALKPVHQKIHFEWVRGHSGIRGNEMADQYAQMARISEEDFDERIVESPILKPNQLLKPTAHPLSRFKVSQRKYRGRWIPNI